MKVQPRVTIESNKAYDEAVEVDFEAQLTSNESKRTKDEGILAHNDTADE